MGRFWGLTVNVWLCFDGSNWYWMSLDDVMVMYNTRWCWRSVIWNGLLSLLVCFWCRLANVIWWMLMFGVVYVGFWWLLEEYRWFWLWRITGEDCWAQWWKMVNADVEWHTESFFFCSGKVVFIIGVLCCLIVFLSVCWWTLEECCLSLANFGKSLHSIFHVQ